LIIAVKESLIEGVLTIITGPGAEKC